ncbi:GntR family transcriptional regulator [Alkalilimnicola ehrlichii]|uniref:GntR family transcriptional regulator n=1 Tax=Alkalilimnicola ehrlichii TaxID=351052 RepID=UPI002162B830|nr:GntR family transcriptional regulator [Alkalilimnicola ehrlichii]
MRGQLPAQARVLEVQLAEELGVSRGPVREALRILEKWRLLRILPRRGAVVADMSAKDVVDLYEIVTPLYELLSRRTAANWTPATLTPIYTVTEQLISCAESGDADGYYENVLAFGRACAPVAGNPLLTEMMADFEPTLRRVHYLSRRRRVEAMPQHLELLRRMMRHVTDREAVEAAAMIRRIADLELRAALDALTPA